MDARQRRQPRRGRRHEWRGRSDALPRRGTPVSEREEDSGPESAPAGACRLGCRSPLSEAPVRRGRVQPAAGVRLQKFAKSGEVPDALRGESRELAAAWRRRTRFSATWKQSQAAGGPLRQEVHLSDLTPPRWVQALAAPADHQPGNVCRVGGSRLVAVGQTSQSKVGSRQYPTLASSSDDCPLCLGT